MRKREHKGITLQGANADLWEIAERHADAWPPGTLDAIAPALGARQDNERVSNAKKAIRSLWHRYAELGPYPFLGTLSEFEFSRAFYPQYRDHVCHQLRVYLLGLGVLDECPSVHDAVLSVLGGHASLDVAWLVTAVFHDVGYIIENESSVPGKAQWERIREEYEDVMAAPLHDWLRITSSTEISGRTKGRIPGIRLGRAGELAADELFQLFGDEAERAGLRSPTSGARPVIQTYYDWTQKTPTTPRPVFRDHGVASALLLTRHWKNLDDYVGDWIPKAGPLLGEDAVQQLEHLRSARAAHTHVIHRAAGAMAIHNVTPSLWSGVLLDASSVGLDFERFRIALCPPSDSPWRQNGLSFLLGLVDTLQDWDRPTFSDVPKENALRGEDLSVRPKGGKVLVYVTSDAEEFRAPARSARSRFGHMMAGLKGYLDPDDVSKLVEWTDDEDPTRVDSDPGADTGNEFPRTLATLLKLLKDVRRRLTDEDTARVLEQMMESLDESPIVDGLVMAANGYLPSCFSIQAVDVLGPQAWASPRAFRYLATQLRYYARANVSRQHWLLKVGSQLGDAIDRAIANAQKGGLQQSLTLFDNPGDFDWSRTTGRPPLEYGRVLLWTEEELLHPLARVVIDIHKEFHVPLFFLCTPRSDPARQFDFICFRCKADSDGKRREKTVGCTNARDPQTGRFRLSRFEDGMVRGQRATERFGRMLEREDITFAVDAKEMVELQRERA